MSLDVCIELLDLGMPTNSKFSGGSSIPLRESIPRISPEFSSRLQGGGHVAMWLGSDSIVSKMHVLLIS